MPNRKKKLPKKKKKKLNIFHAAKRAIKRSSTNKLKTKVTPTPKNARRKVIKKLPAELTPIHEFLASTKRHNSAKMNTKCGGGQCDKGGVKRLFSPFNKFYLTRPPSRPVRAISDSPRKVALTPKERGYILCSCQARTSRYAKLKNLAADAIKNHKIFLIYGYCNSLRQALVERGWVEKIPPNRMDLDKIRGRRYNDNEEMHVQLERLLLSNFVEKYQPNFIWNARDDFNETMPAMHNVIYNRLRVEAQWTTKQGLCASAKNHYWYYIEDVAEVNTPRTYTSTDEDEKQDFEADYKLTACTSLLKWVLSMVANDRPIFLETGKVATNVIVFALNRCKEYIFSKQNKDIDKLFTKTVTPGQWNSFLKKYYVIIGKQDTFKLDKENKLPLYLGYAKFLLKEIHKYRPQLSCEGCHNIWIIKPTHCSRGRGIRLASKLGVLSDLLTRGKYVFQKYIEEPLLVHGTKFDIRQYYLITSTGPLVIWMYKDCYLKFSSQKYSLKNYHESIHLTNNAVQKKYKNCDDRHPELPVHNMWSLETYKEYLSKIGKENIWDTVIYPGMKKSIIGTMLSCQESISYSKNRFELYGCDFILDKDYKPWLIEINSCPDLSPTTPVTASICSAVLSDIIKVVIDVASNPRAPTGKFECIYRQTMSGPRYSTGATDLTVRGYALPADYFYKGNFQVLEQVDDTKNEKKQHDINEMLHRMKMLYDNDIMVEPECSDTKIEDNQDDQSKSDDEDLHVAATIITEQLDTLLDRITFENCPSGKSSMSSPSSINLRKKYVYGKNLPDAQSVLDGGDHHESKQIISTKENVNERSFNFSKLDDGPEGKASDLVQLTSSKVISAKAEEKLISAKTEEKSDANLLILHKAQTEQKGEKSDNIINATKKLLNFLDQKAKEYTNSEPF